MIKTKGLTKCFDDQIAVNHISMTVKKGSVYGLVGPNGAGKTTLIKMLTGIYRPTEGSLEVDNQSVEDNIELKDSLYYMCDQIQFDRGVTIKEMAKLYSCLYSNFDMERFNKIKEHLNFKDKQKINKLSKGMKKQVSFMLGLSIHPKWMVLDEPIDGLDPVIRKRIWSMVMQEVAEYETTVLISSHNLKELEGVCDTIGILYEGKLIAEKELDDMKSDLHKVQIAYEGEVDMSLVEILHDEQIGSLRSMILRGTKEQISHCFEQVNIMMMDYLPLSFEEIFIYELGGAGYEITNLIL